MIAKTCTTQPVMRAVCYAALLVVTLSITGCATPPPSSNPLALAEYQSEHDPLQPMNRKFYSINDSLDQHISEPLTHTYLHITTQWFRTHSGNFIRNLSAPIDMIYFMAAGKPRDAGTMLVRFALNSTIGVGGIFDPAAQHGYQPVETDLGLVLAGYGVPNGPYLFIPLVGPTTVRDGMASIAGSYAGGAASFFNLVPVGATRLGLSYGTALFGTANERSSLDGVIQNVKATALDPYAVFRSLYRQHRLAQLRAIDLADTPTPPDWFGPKQNLQ